MNRLKRKKNSHEIDDDEREEEVEDEEEEEEEEQVEKPVKKRKEKEKDKQRYAPFDIPRRIGIIDTETEEVIAGGDNPNDAILQALANLKSQVERIENMIGSILED